MRRLSVVIVSGLSGSGKSQALAVLEDLGYFCVDNLPPLFLPQMVRIFSDRKDVSQIAVCIDVRARGFLEDVPPALQSLRDEGYEVRVLFLDCADDALLRRFSETRRPHPLAVDGDVKQGISAERTTMSSLRDMADMLLDTTHFHVHELRQELVERFSLSAPLEPKMRVRVVSFGFKYGPPTNADMVFDVRFLPNPFFVDELRSRTGLDPAVRNFLLKDRSSEGFLKRAVSLLSYLIPRYEREGRSYLTIAVGCTGGQHRSVTIAEEICRRLREKRPVQATHRDILREPAPTGSTARTNARRNHDRHRRMRSRTAR